MKKIIRASGLILYRKEKGQTYYLLLRDDSGWNFPKGHMNEREKELETAMRETEEETGIKISSVLKEFKEKISYFVDKNPKEVIFYLAEVSQKNVVLSSEHTEYGWFTFEEALSKLSFENTKNLLRMAHKFLKTNE